MLLQLQQKSGFAVFTLELQRQQKARPVDCRHHPWPTAGKAPSAWAGAFERLSREGKVEIFCLAWLRRAFQALSPLLRHFLWFITNLSSLNR